MVFVSFFLDFNGVYERSPVEVQAQRCLDDEYELSGVHC